MDAFLNWIITYLNPINLLNLLWDLCLDLFYMVIQGLVDLLTLLVSGINWICPVFPNLSPPPMVLSVARNVAWVDVFSCEITNDDLLYRRHYGLSRDSGQNFDSDKKRTRAEGDFAGTNF